MVILAAILILIIASLLVVLVVIYSYVELEKARDTYFNHAKVAQKKRLRTSKCNRVKK